MRQHKLNTLQTFEIDRVVLQMGIAFVGQNPIYEENRSYKINKKNIPIIYFTFLINQKDLRDKCSRILHSADLEVPLWLIKIHKAINRSQAKHTLKIEIDNKAFLLKLKFISLYLENCQSKSVTSTGLP